MIKVILVDDHSLLREGIRTVLHNSAIDIEVIGQAGNAAELLKLLSEKKPDIVILDILLPDRSGIDVLKDIKKMHAKLPVLILSMHPENRYAVRALRAGASGYLSKIAAPHELIRAIRVIVKQKKRYISAKVGQELAEQLSNGEKKLPHELLSDREYEVMCLIVDGKKASEIASELSLSVQTIHTYQARIKEKMDISSKAELIRYAIENNLVD